MRRALSILIFFLVKLQAQEPHFEFGLGIGSLYYPDYIGTKTTQTLTLPIPYVRYKSEHLNIDEDGVSSKIFGIKRLQLDLSLSGSLPASSSEESPRAGMETLELTGEIGPKILYELYYKGVSRLDFECDIRAALSTDYTSISYRGIVMNPQLKYSLNYKHLEWTLRAGVLFNDADYNNYYYGVSKEYETVQREQYTAEGGYSGTRLRSGLTYKKLPWWGGAFISHHNINGAVFESSPLIEVKEALYFGASIAYIFYTIE
ncbi:MAG: MipA/OmpV family protein [Campylobacterales bacterium]|nr:MipA/OmpV family protein [Campylobacterales bacterium]